MALHSQTTVEIGNWRIIPHATPDNKVHIEVMRMEGYDYYDHPYGTNRTIDVEEYFKSKEAEFEKLVKQAKDTGISILKQEKLLSDSIALLCEQKKLRLKRMIVIDNTFQELSELFADLLAVLPEVDRIKFIAECEERVKERDRKVAEAHGNNESHYPPSENCPACLKIFEKLENEARKLLPDAGEGELSCKVWELFKDRYCVKGKTDESQAAK